MFRGSLRTEVRVNLIKPHDHWEIPSLRVHCSASIPNIEGAELLAIAHAARVEAVLTRALRAEITMTVSLDGAPGREWHVAPDAA